MSSAAPASSDAAKPATSSARSNSRCAAMGSDDASSRMTRARMPRCTLCGWLSRVYSRTSFSSVRIADAYLPTDSWLCSTLPSGATAYTSLSSTPSNMPAASSYSLAAASLLPMPSYSLPADSFTSTARTISPASSSRPDTSAYSAAAAVLPPLPGSGSTVHSRAAVSSVTAACFRLPSLTLQCAACRSASSARSYWPAALKARPAALKCGSAARWSGFHLKALVASLRTGGRAGGVGGR